MTTTTMKHFTPFAICILTAGPRRLREWAVKPISETIDPHGDYCVEHVNSRAELARGLRWARKTLKNKATGHDARLFAQAWLEAADWACTVGVRCEA